MQRQNAVDHGVQNGLDQHRAIACLLLHPIFFGDIAKHQHRAYDLAITGADRGAAVCDIVFAAIACNQHGVVGQALHRAVQQGFQHRVDYQCTAGFVDDAQNGFDLLATGQLHAPTGELLGQRVEAGDAGLVIGGDDTVTNRTQGHRQLFLADLQGTVGVLQLLVEQLLHVQQMPGLQMQQMALALQALAVDQVGQAKCGQQPQQAGRHHQAKHGAQLGLVVGLVLCQNLLLDLYEGLHACAYGVHQALALATADDAQNFGILVGPSQLDDVAQLGQFGIHQGRHGLQLLGGVFGLHQLLQLLQLRGQALAHGQIGLQKRFVAGDQKATLTGLRVFECGQKVVARGDHRQGMSLGNCRAANLAVGPEAECGTQGQQRGGKQQRCPHFFGEFHGRGGAWVVRENALPHRAAVGAGRTFAASPIITHPSLRPAQ